MMEKAVIYLRQNEETDGWELEYLVTGCDGVWAFSADSLVCAGLMLTSNVGQWPVP